MGSFILVFVFCFFESKKKGGHKRSLVEVSGDGEGSSRELLGVEAKGALLRTVHALRKSAFDGLGLKVATKARHVLVLGRHLRGASAASAGFCFCLCVVNGRPGVRTLLPEVVLCGVV